MTYSHQFDTLIARLKQLAPAPSTVKPVLAAHAPKLRFTSNNPSVATVSSTGKIAAKKRAKPRYMFRP